MSHPVPDAHGLNFFAADAGRDLLDCYLPKDLHELLSQYLLVLMIILG